jgi:methylmalonyl-CoA mutase
MDKLNKNLFDEFPPVPLDEWDKKTIADLKGADYEKKLVWKPNEGFRVKPYYVSDDLQQLEYLQLYPDQFPYARGNNKAVNEWFIRQDLQVSDLKRTNEKALDILMKGIDSLGLILDEDTEYTKDDLDLLLKNIFAEMVEINFTSGKHALSLMKNHYEMLVRYNRDFQKIYGSIGYDPFGRLITRGRYHSSLEEDLETCRQLIKTSEHLPHFTVISVNGDHFHHAGATIVEELAFSLASGAEYLTRLTEAGLSVNQVAPKIRFRFATGSNYFMEIAKYRAARLLWAHIVKAYGPSRDDVAKMTIHAVTSRWNKAMYDPYVNMLRTTTESMSAIIAGIDSLTVGPFNEAFGKPTDFSERIARNQQLLLKEESYLDRVIDPSAGSYYIENLTDSLAAEAWKLFLEVDAQGGFLEAVSRGHIQRRIAATAEKRDAELSGRRDVILGVNQYPNFLEMKDENIPDSVFQTSSPDPDAIVETLRLYRGAQPFEALRYKTDLYAREHKRPSAFMLTYGNLAMRIARSQFSRNFFACAGFETIDNLGFNTVEEGVQAFIDSKADILVLCSADEEYPVIAPAVKELAGEKVIVVVAGYPKDIVDELRAKGVEYFIHVRSNVLEDLKKYQSLLGL